MAFIVPPIGGLPGSYQVAWCLENLVEGKVVNQIAVDAEIAEWARVALERMLAIT